jgi:hypothetical protein
MTVVTETQRLDTFRGWVMFVIALFQLLRLFEAADESIKHHSLRSSLVVPPSLIISVLHCSYHNMAAVNDVRRTASRIVIM